MQEIKVIYENNKWVVSTETGEITVKEVERVINKMFDGIGDITIAKIKEVIIYKWISYVTFTIMLILGGILLNTLFFT